MAAGTKPPLVMQTMAAKGPLSARRQASARASRWNWSQDTGNVLRELVWVMGFGLGNRGSGHPSSSSTSSERTTALSLAGAGYGSSIATCTSGLQPLHNPAAAP